MKKYLLIIGLLFSFVYSYSQNYEIDTYNGQTVTTCSGNFYDSGGSFGNYLPGESYEVTFCPGTPGTSIDLDFSYFNVSSGASLVVFDGPDNTYNNFGTFSNGGFSPVGMGVTATPTNTSGCLTVSWTSGGGIDDGWDAAVSCQIPCQTVLSTLISSSPAITPDGYIDVCPGQQITLIGGGIYPENNLVYTQGNNTSIFVWDFGNGLTDSSMSNITSIQYDTISGYNINLTVYDTLGCTNTNLIGIRVRVSTHPVFAGTMPDDPAICDGTQTTLLGEVETVPYEVTAELSLAGTTFLPDGSGASYTTSLVFEAFAPGQTLTNVNDFLSICAVMEHSYLGDLDITLECPNGTVVALKTYPGCGSTYLGEPIDVDTDLSPGVGYEYCWSPNPTYGSMNAECGSYSTMPAGSYAPVGNFSDFVGCPLNGAWTIEVTDNLLSDNGYIFEWGINFDPSILPANFNYEPSIVDEYWTVPSPTILVADNDSDVVIEGNGQGIYPFTFTVEDDFGCTYDTTVDVQVYVSYMVNFPPDTVICSNATLQLDASNNGQNVGAEYVWHWDFTGDDTISVADNFIVDKPGLYWVDIPNIEPACGHIDSIYVTYNEMELELGSDIEDVCSNNAVTLDATTDLGNYPSVSYLWSTGEVTPTIIAPSSGTYSVSVARGYCIETDVIDVDYDIPLPTMTLGPDQYICQGDLVTLDAGYIGYDYLWSTGALSQIIEVSLPGTYTLTITNACGSYSDDVDVILVDEPTVDLGPDQYICFGQAYFLNAEYIGTGPAATYLWSTNETLPAIAAFNEGFYSVTVTNQCGFAIDQIFIGNDYPLNINLGNDTTICSGDTLTLDPGVSGNSYYWSTTENTPTIDVTVSDSYSVDIENACGIYSDFINITVENITVDLGPDTTLCPGSTIEFDAMNPGNSYLWSNGNTGQVINVTSEGTYSVTVQSSNNCLDEDEVVVTEFVPDLNLGLDTSICEGSSLELDAGYEGSTFDWSTGENTQIIEVFDAGNYTVTVHHFCGDLNDNIQVDINPVPVIDFGADTISILYGSSTVLDAGNAGAVYIWSTGETTQTIEVSTQDTYSVTVTDGNGCSAENSVFVEVRVGISEIEFENAISIYPNPASTNLYIVSDNEIIKEVELYSAIGKLVRKNINAGNNLELDLNGLSEGIYFVRVFSLSGNSFVNSLSIVK